MIHTLKQQLPSGCERLGKVCSSKDCKSLFLFCVRVHPTVRHSSTPPPRAHVSSSSTHERKHFRNSIFSESCCFFREHPRAQKQKPPRLPLRQDVCLKQKHTSAQPSSALREAPTPCQAETWGAPWTPATLPTSFQRGSHSLSWTTRRAGAIRCHC